jgi:NEDD8-activating enzyme E1 regulatory subunit
LFVDQLAEGGFDFSLQHDGQPPKSAEEKKDFKTMISNMAFKADEENFEEAVAQAYRAWTETTVPSEIRDLFERSSAILDDLPSMQSSPNAQFYRLLWTLREFVKTEPYTLPLTSTLPDMKADTQNYIHLQQMYKVQAEVERSRFKDILYRSPNSAPGESVEDAVADEFVRNAHAIRVLNGEPWGAFDKDPKRLGMPLSFAFLIKSYIYSEKSLVENPNGTAIHLALSALDIIRSGLPIGSDPTQAAHHEALRSEVHRLTNVPLHDLPEAIDTMVGEV